MTEIRRRSKHAPIKKVPAEIVNCPWIKPLTVEIEQVFWFVLKRIDILILLFGGTLASG